MLILIDTIHTGQQAYFPGGTTSILNYWTHPQRNDVHLREYLSQSALKDLLQNIGLIGVA